ncbi:MAG: TonB-dependent receptor plug domain-containing protein [Steroidobacteraceae bacterium]
MRVKFLFPAGIACIASLSVATETVVVSASPVSPDGELATLVESVSRDEILRAGGANLADALANTPGVTGTAFASGASRPVIRGFDASRVRVLEDGIGSFDVSDVGPDHGVPIDPLSAERIEVIRGAATLRYGSQAIGGVVNAINNRVPIRMPSAPFSAELSSLYGTNAQTRQGSALLDAALGDFAFHADGFQRRAEDYDTPDGKLANSFFDGGGYSFSSSYFFGPNRLGAALVHYDARYGIPDEDNYIDMRQTKEMLRSSFAPDFGPLHRINVDAGYADYEHSELTPEGEVESTFKDREWDARAEALFGATGPIMAAALGVQLQEKNFSALGAGADYMLPARTRSAAAFAFGDTPLRSNLHLHTGLRVERVSIDGTPADDVGVSRSYTPLRPSCSRADRTTALRRSKPGIPG